MSRGKGHPRSFKDAEEFLSKFKEYKQYCNEEDRLVNIAGFCAYCTIHRDTFYAQEQYYSDTFKVIQSELEDAALNHKATAMGIFYLKNKFGYVDKVETVNTNLNMNSDLDDLTEEQIDARIKELKEKV